MGHHTVRAVGKIQFLAEDGHDLGHDFNLFFRGRFAAPVYHGFIGIPVVFRPHCAPRRLGADGGGQFAGGVVPAAQGDADGAAVAHPGMGLALAEIIAGGIHGAVLVDAQVVIVIHLAVMASGPVQVDGGDAAPGQLRHLFDLCFRNFHRVFY